MMMKDMHELECPQCKIRDQFYEDFNNDSKKNVSYFGVISYVNQYVVMPVSSDQPKEEISKNNLSYKSSNICFLQLINEWAIRDTVSNGLLKHIKEKKKKPYIKPPPFYMPQNTGSFTIKKSESFTESPADSLCSAKLKATKDVFKCKLTKKRPSKEKVVAARKEPKVGTLKRKRWNWEKLKQNDKYEDDLFEEKKFKRILLDETSNFEVDRVATPVWSVQISPRAQSRSPSYEDCYSPTELQSIRKDAEEYQYRRNKRKFMGICKKKEEPTAEMKTDPDTYKTLEKVRDKLEKLEKKDCDSEEDYYFTDGEDSDN